MINQWYTGIPCICHGWFNITPPPPNATWCAHMNMSSLHPIHQPNLPGLDVLLKLPEWYYVATASTGAHWVACWLNPVLLFRLHLIAYTWCWFDGVFVAFFLRHYSLPEGNFHGLLSSTWISFGFLSHISNESTCTDSFSCCCSTLLAHFALSTNIPTSKTQNLSQCPLCNICWAWPNSCWKLVSPTTVEEPGAAAVCPGGCTTGGCAIRCSRVV